MSIGIISGQDEQVICRYLQENLRETECTVVCRLGGLTNRSYRIRLSEDREYVFRIPGEGTEEMIARKDECVSTKLACDLGLDADLLFFGEDGVKISQYIPDAVTMTAGELREEIHISQVAGVFRKLHTCGIDTGVPFDVFEMAELYEKVIGENHVTLYEDYGQVRENVMRIKSSLDEEQGTIRVPCHNDPLCENWIEGNGRMYLVDWEYAGMNDGMWDLADVAIEAAYDRPQEIFLLRQYLQREVTDRDWKRFEANKIYLDHLWALWGKTRVPFDGEAMEQYALGRYLRLKENIKKYKEQWGE